MPSQIIQRLAAADTEYRTLKKTLEARLRQQLNQELERAGAKRDLIAFNAEQAGEKIITIAQEGLHTKDRKTAYDAIERGRQMSPDAPIVVSEEGGEVIISSEFTLVDDDTVRVTPAEETLAPILPLLGHDNPDAALREADFRIAGGGRLEPITPAFDATTGRNAVVALVLAENGEYRGRVLDWLRGKGMAA